ncbi:MAG: hypothetical protein JRN52_03145 [Nitrososphaerota archaeon]|nr:hypothetical protein [Nitrososphaerota archaeon]
MRRQAGIARSALIVVVVIIIVVAGVGYALLSTTGGPTTTSSTSTLTTTSSASPVGTTSSTTSSTTTASPKPSSISMEINVATGPLDPFEDHGGVSQEWLAANVYESLVYYNSTTNQLIPWLAVNYTSDASGQLWTFNLRHGVTFSDGTPFNGTAVKDSIDWEIVSHNTGAASTLAQFIPGAKTVLSSNFTQQDITTFENSDGITVVNPYEVQFNLTKPTALFPAYLAQVYYSFMVSPSAVLANGGITAGQGNAWLNTHSAGTGPYVISSYDATSGNIVLNANKNYWAATVFDVVPPFQTVYVNVVTNPTTQELDIRTGAANVIYLPASELYDFANRSLWATQSQLVSTVPGTTIWGPYAGAGFQMFELNGAIHLQNGSLSAVQPFKNPDIVKGFNYAWNQSAFIQSSLNGLGLTFQGLILQQQLGYQEFSSPYPFNLTMAKEELTKGCQALGCSPSNPLQILLQATNDPTQISAAGLLASNIDSLQVGINVVVSVGSATTAISVFLSRTFGIYVASSGNNPIDPFISPMGFFGYGPSFGAVYAGYNDSTVNSLLAQASASPNQTLRSQLYAQANMQIAQDGQFMPISQLVNVIVTSSTVRITDYNLWKASYLPLIVELAPA